MQEATNHWQRLEDLFHRALDLPESTRTAHAREWCAKEPDLLSELLEMLASDSSVEKSLSSGAVNFPVAALVRPSEDTWLGRTLGPFQLERQLGHGGMGVVYFGRRIGGGFTQSVAVKLIARHLHSAPAVQQFILERDTLARLEHKNIARLIDAGVTPEGTPYVAMEYIEGRLLDQVCDDAALNLKDKVHLLLQLCEAVAYVHRNLILHRDLKPSNVMVDNDGNVKLLDFGTLKLLGPSAQLSSEMTQAGMRAITLRYASPEHIEGKPLSTSSDVYSLGMILYRVLAGRLPDGMSGLAPSDYVSRLRRGAIAPPIPTGNAGKQLADDLSAIAMKAIRFEAATRYASVDELALDLQRALDQRPVSARQGTTRYLLERFVRRNRMPLSAAAAAVLMLTIGVAAMMHEAAIARAQSLRADAGIEEERKLTHTLLFDYFDQLKRVPASTDAQRRAVAQALDYLDSLNKTSTSSALQLDSIRAYTEMGLLQGSIYEENLGDAPGAIVTLRKSVALAQQLKDTSPGNQQYLNSYVGAERALGQVYFGAGDANNALKHLTAAADAGQRMLAMPGVTPEMVTLVASASDLLGDTYGLPSAGTLNDPAKAIARYKQAQEADRAGLRLQPGNIIYQRGIAVEDWKLGMDATDEPSAETYYRDALACLARLPAQEQGTPRIRRMDNLISQSLGLALMDSGRISDGLATILPAQHALQAGVIADPLDARARADLALLDSNLANAFEDIDRPKDAIAANQEFLVNVDAILRKDPTNSIWQFRRALALARAGRLLQSTNKSQALQLGTQALAIVTPLALKPDAGPRILDLASRSLTGFHPDPPHDAPLAVSFAQRAVAGNAHPDAEPLVILAEAQLFAKDKAAAKTSADAANRVLGSHPNCFASAALQARALRVLQASSQ